MAIDFSKNRDKDIEEITEKLFDKLQKQGLVAEEIGEQVGESFATGVEQGFEDASSRIAASSVKITKAFKDLAKKITNQKDIFNISLGGKDVVVDIDFSDIDINSDELQKKINETFEKIKIDSGVEFDSKSAEKQFKDMLGLHAKYAAKLSKLQTQAINLTNPDSIKLNAKEQLAVIDGLREIQRIANDISDNSVLLPHVYFGDIKDLRTKIDLVDKIKMGEEKVGKQRDTNNKKLQEENKKLKKRNELYEEKYGVLQEESAPKPKKPRAQKAKEPSEQDIARQRGEEMKVFVAQFESLQKELGDTSRWFGKFNDFLNQIQQGSLTAAEAVAKLREEVAAPVSKTPSPAIPSVDEILAEFKEGVKPNEIDDIGDIKAENGALEDRLELLKDISETYGSNGLTKDAKAYYKLWLKEMDGQEFTDAQDERYSEVHGNLENAAKALVSFGKVYEKIIIKFGKGKDLEILPNAEGLAALAKIDDEYGESYNGKEISDVVFVRAQEAVARAAEEARLAEEFRRAEAERVAKEQEEAERRALELAKQRAEEEAKITAEKEKQLSAENHYYPINEDAAKRAKEANSYSDYVPGSATAEYKRQVDAARQLVEQQKSRVDSMYHEKIDQLFDTYARKLAENMNKSFEIDARMPSYLITGGGNFNVGKKQKQNAARDKNMEEWNQIQGLLDKIRGTGTGGISADDDQAVAKLEAKLKSLMEYQQLMKDVNAYFRKHGTLDGFEGLSEIAREQLKRNMDSPWHLEKSKPFQSYQLDNNNAEIRRIKERIEALNKHETQEYPEWEFDGGYVKSNKEINRIQIFFDGKPAEDVRDQMKANAFKWSPKEGAWQRQLNDNAYRAMDHIDAIQPSTGEKPYAMLLKAKAEQKRLAEDIAEVEEKSDAQAITAEQTQLDTAQEKLKVEKEIVVEQEKSHQPEDIGIKQEIKSQEDLQKEIEDTNRVIKIQKQWLDYLDSVLDEENFKTSGKREASEQLKSKTLRLLDVRRHPEQYAHLSDYETKAELAQSQAYKEAERQGVAQSTLNRHFTDAVIVHDQNIKKLQEERALHVGLLENAEKELATLQQQLQIETQIEKVRKHKFASTINGKSGKFRIQPQSPNLYETESGQMSMLPTVESEIEAKEKLAKANDKVAKTQRRVNTSTQVAQLTLDDVIPESVEDTAPKIEEEAKTLDKVGEAAEKAASKKKKFAKANREVADSATKSVKSLTSESDAMSGVDGAANSFAARHGVGVITGFGTQDMMDFNLPVDYFGEKGQEAVQVFAKMKDDIEQLTGQPVTIDFVSEVKENGQLEAVGATLKYVNEAAGVTVKQFYDIQRTEEGIIVATQSHEKATLAASKAAKIFNTELEQQYALEQIKTLESRMGALTDGTGEFTTALREAKEAAMQIDGKEGLDNFRLKLKMAQEKSKQLKSDLKGQNTLDTIASMEHRLLVLPNQIKKMESELSRLGDAEGAEKVAHDIDEINKKYAEFLEENDANKKVKLFRDITSSMILVNSNLSTIKYDTAQIKREQDKLNAEYDEYIKLIEKRDAIEAKMMGLDPVKNRDELEALRAVYNDVDNEFNSKYGDFLSRKDVQDHFSIDELEAARRKTNVQKGKNSDKARMQQEEEAQKKVNEAYREYVRLIQERGRESTKLAGLDPEKNKDQIDAITSYIDSIDVKLNETYGDLLSNKVAQATLTIEDFMKYYDKWQQKIKEKESQAADKARNKEELPYRNYGKTTANSAERKLAATQGSIDALGVTDATVLAKMDAYKAKVKEVLDIREQFTKDPEAAKDPKLVKDFQKAAYEAEQLRRGIKTVIDEEQKMMQMSSEQGFDPIELSAQQLANLKNEMASFAQEGANGRVEMKGWNADNTKMYYTITDSKGAVQEMTLALGQGTNQLYKYRTATKETGTLMQQIFKGVKVKAKELISYVIGGGSVYKVITMLKQGVQYVREIDIALTELKKVTDETEETYREFLKTASKTAAKVGSTIKDVVSSTADWARLGYSMEEAAKFAESTQILMNVSEFTDVSRATDTLISSVQAFGYTAETSMDVVDLLNTIGNNYAISTADLAQSLTKSSASLVAAGGDLAEAAALTATANKIIQDADSVGK